MTAHDPASFPDLTPMFCELEAGPERRIRTDTVVDDRLHVTLLQLPRRLAFQIGLTFRTTAGVSTMIDK